jgi:hypothetical protein
MVTLFVQLVPPTVQVTVYVVGKEATKLFPAKTGLGLPVSAQVTVPPVHPVCESVTKSGAEANCVGDATAVTLQLPPEFTVTVTVLVQVVLLTISLQVAVKVVVEETKGFVVMAFPPPSFHETLPPVQPVCERVTFPAAVSVLGFAAAVMLQVPPPPTV